MKKVFVDSYVLNSFIFVIKRLKNNANGNPVYEITRVPACGGAGELRKCVAYSLLDIIKKWAEEL